MEEIYVDASCRVEDNVASWAVVTSEHQYSGLIRGQGMFPFYCELYAVYQALLLASQYDDVIIYCDNLGVVKMLNKDVNEFLELLDYSIKRRGALLHEVYYLYQDMPNVHICKVPRSKNKIADRVAKNMLYKNVKW